MQKFKQLRQKHPEFIYQNHSYYSKNKHLVINFNFLLSPDIKFKPEITIPNAFQASQKLPQKTLNNLIFHLGLIEMISYWKAACSPVIKIQVGNLNNQQLDWWHDLIIRGMGEFFYQNQIDFTQKDFLAFHIKSSSSSAPLLSISQKKSYLTLVGGGKDSVVAIEALKKANLNQSLFFLNPTPAGLKVADQSGIKETFAIKRQIDKKLLKLNQKGYLNGHTPFSAYLAFLSILVAGLFKFKHIVVSNERSADEANLEYLNHQINHQYSKTFQFEKKFKQYQQKYLTSSIKYFSLARPLWEIQISKIFTQFPQYFSSFLSCNQGQKQNQWCCQCPKCLSSFILFYPFLDSKTTQIFSKNLYKDFSLKPLLLKLTQKDKIKPFECVATREEIIIGLYLSLKKTNHNFPLLSFAQKNILNNQKNLQVRADKLLKSWGNDQLISKDIIKILKELNE